MKKIYIAGAYSGDVPANLQRAIDAGNECIRLGYSPFVPHLYHFLHLSKPQGYETWMSLCMDWLAQCDVLWRLPGASPGASREVDRARQLGIKVVHSLKELLEAVPGVECA